MAAEYSKAVTAFVRSRLIGQDNDNLAPLVHEFKVSAPTLSNIRDGNRGVGIDVARKIAAARYEGKLALLDEAAIRFVEEHPELMPAYGIFEQALGRLVIRDSAKASYYRAAFQEAIESYEFDSPENLDVGKAEETLRSLVSNARGKSVGEREL